MSIKTIDGADVKEHSKVFRLSNGKRSYKSYRGFPDEEYVDGEYVDMIRFKQHETVEVFEGDILIRKC